MENLPSPTVLLGDEHPDDTTLPSPSERPSYYRNKDTDSELYNQLWEVYEPCILPHRLLELLHLYDTQVNEAMNQLVAKFAPKNECLGTSMALTHRVYVAVGIHNLGYHDFWKRVYDDLKLSMSSVLANHLLNKDKEKNRRRERQSKPSTKRKRNHDNYLKIQEGILKAR